MSDVSITMAEVGAAKTKLSRMRRKLVKWLEYRKIVDDVASGARPTKKAAAREIARQQISQRGPAELELASRLHSLLSTIEPDIALPEPSSSGAAVALAGFAVTGKLPSTGSTQGGLGSIGGAAHPWMWPALIVGGLLLAVTTVIHTAADVVKDREEKACIASGACTDYGFWLKAAAALGISWFVWKEMGVGDVVKRKMRSL